MQEGLGRLEREAGTRREEDSAKVALIRYCTVLYSTVLYSIVLYRTVPYCSTLYLTLLYCPGRSCRAR